MYSCEKDAHNWQLYSDMDGAEGVARHLSSRLTTLVRKAKADLRAHPMLSELKLAKSIRDEMYELMEKYSRCGASDTEPSGVLVEELEEAFGLEQYSLER